MIGDRMMNTAVCVIFAQPRTLVPPLLMPAPISPPISACDELDGIPYHQVMRFQPIAPISAATTTVLSTTCGSTIPLPMVLATCSGKKTNATKLKKAAHATAMRGESTRVETTVAIEFAASWNPLM